MAISGAFATIAKGIGEVAKEFSEAAKDIGNTQIEDLDSPITENGVEDSLEAESSNADINGNEIDLDAPISKVVDNIENSENDKYSEKPSGNDGINKEGRTLKEIADKPITDECRETAKENLEKAKVSEETINKIDEILKNEKCKDVPDYSDGKNVDLSSASLFDINVKLPSAQEILAKICEKHKLSPEEVSKLDRVKLKKYIREVNYEIVQQALGEKLGISKNAAAQLIGDIDCTIHEANDGSAIIVPNNIHNYKQHYRHEGYASKVYTEITGKVDEHPYE